MPIIRSKEVFPPPSIVTKKISPSEPMPDDSLIRDYGVDTLRAGQECDLHYHDCEEWWVIVNGSAKIICGSEEGEAKAGDMIFTRMGEEHKISAITDTTLVWLEGPLKGNRRPGHLHI